MAIRVVELPKLALDKYFRPCMRLHDSNSLADTFSNIVSNVIAYKISIKQSN